MEQKNIGLEWYKTVEELYHRFDPEALAHSKRNRKNSLPNCTLIRMRAERWFKDVWNLTRESCHKLVFYNSIKKELGFEPYLHLEKHKKIKFIAWLRTSSHLFKIETDKYGENKLASTIECVTFVLRMTKNYFNFLQTFPPSN